MLERERQNTPVHTANIKDADGYAVTEQQALARELRKIHMYGKRFIYCAFAPSLLGRVLQTGTYRGPNDEDPNVIFGCIINPPGTREPGIRDTDNMDIFDYFVYDTALPELNQVYGMIAVYDKRRFKPMEDRLEDGKINEVSHPLYQFKEPGNKLDALLAVVRVVDR